MGQPELDLGPEAAREEPETTRTTKGGVEGGHEVLWDGDGEPHVPAMWHCRRVDLRPEDVVADVGAYCGTYAMIATQAGVRKVTAWEPTPRTFEVLRRNLSDLDAAVARNAAVVGREDDVTAEGKVELHVSAGLGCTNSIVKARRKPRSVLVDAVPYAEAVRGATVVKVDVEGAEYEYPLVQPGVRALIVEFHPTGAGWRREARRKMERVADAGFDLVVEPDFSNGWTRDAVWTRDLSP